MSLLLDPEPFQKFSVGSGKWVGGGQKAFKSSALVQILAIYTHILTPVKSEFSKLIKMMDFREGINCFKNTSGLLGLIPKLGDLLYLELPKKFFSCGFGL